MTLMDEKAGTSSAPTDNVFETIKKVQKAHARSIIGVKFVRNPDTRDDYLVTCSHESVKFWHVDPESAAILEEKVEIKGWRSGVQDFDITRDGKLLAVVGVDSVLHRIIFSWEDMTHTRDTFSIGHMEIWHIRIVSEHMHFFTVSFSGFLTMLDMNGKTVQSVPFKAVKQVSSVACSTDGRFIAVANTEGVVTVVCVPDLRTLVFFEAHALKLRALSFSPSSDQLLTGADDKIIKLYSIFASCGNDDLVMLWSTAGDRPIHIFTNMHDGVVKNIAFSLDGTCLSSVGDDRLICLHRISEHRSVVEFDIMAETKQQEQSQIQSFSSQVSENGMRIASTEEQKRNNKNHTQPFSGLGVSLDEDDELLIRARRDLEGISDEDSPK